MPVDPKIPPALCVREADVPRGTRLPPGVVHANCAGCGARLVLATSTRDAARRGEMQPVCRPCLEASRPADLYVAAMTPAQAEQMRAFDRFDAERN